MVHHAARRRVIGFAPCRVRLLFFADPRRQADKIVDLHQLASREIRIICFFIANAVMEDEMYKRLLIAMIMAGILAGVPRAEATVIFDWVCSADNGTTVTVCPYGLSLSLGFKDEIIESPNFTFTGADAMLDSLTFSSTFGTGFTTTLADLTGTTNTAEKANFQVVFDPTKQKVMRLNDATPDVLLWVGLSLPAPGAIRFNEGTGQSINPLTDKDYTYNINGILDRDPISLSFQVIDGIFRRRADAPKVAEPPQLLLFAAGIVGVVVARRRRPMSKPA
jgi:hypothetical protein